MNVKAVIFDMDGVILDSEKLYVRFWREAGRACGYPFETKHALAIRSLARPFAIQKLQGFFGEGFDYDEVRNKRIELMENYVEQNGIDLKPYAEYTLKELKKRGYKIALATATPPERAQRYLTRSGLYDYFDKIICSAMVKLGKPEPDIYLKACEEVGFLPEECIAVEDSPNGIQSAYRAGCRAVMVPDLDEPDDAAREMTYAVVKDLEELLDIC